VKKFMLFVILAVALVVTASPSVMVAQDKLNAFSTKEACLNAMRSGDFTFYEPKFFGLRGKNPVDGKTKKTAQLEEDACVNMLTVGGVKWVPQQKGTTFRFWVNNDESLGYAYARDDCGNPVYEVAYPSSSEQPSSDQQPTEPTNTPTQQQVQQQLSNCANTEHLLAQAQAGDRRKKNISVSVVCEGTKVEVVDFKPSKPASSNGGGEGFWHRFWDEPVVGVPVEYGYGGYNTGWGGGYNRNWNSGNRGNNHGGGHSGGSGGSAGTGNAH